MNIKISILVVLLVCLTFLTSCSSTQESIKTKPQLVEDLMIAEDNLYYGIITYDEFIDIASDVFYDAEKYDLVGFSRLGRDKFNISQMSGMDIDNMRDYLNSNGLEFMNIENMPEEYKSYVEISKVYDDPDGIFSYVIAFQVEEFNDFDQYRIYKFTFQERDEEDLVVMVDIDQRYARDKVGDNMMSLEDMEEMLSNTVARKYYGEPVEYISNINLAELQREILNK